MQTRRLVPLEEFRTHAQLKMSPTTRRPSSDSPINSADSVTWQKSFGGSRSHSLPDILTLLALHRPDALYMLDRLARAFAEPVLHDLEESECDEVS
jgi:predicted oxidoreductase